jgi:type IV/VI secretion system ImpK/VasF family protein
MPTLREVFTPLIAYTLFLTRTPAEYSRPSAEIRRDLDRLLEQQGAAVKRSDIAPQDYENASFAVIAWVDEAVTRRAHESNPELFAEWRRAPLQVQLFNTANAGEEFFERLARLTPAQKNVIELYHQALCLGFRGRFYDESQDAQLIELRRQYAAHLPAPLLEPLEFETRQEYLTPQPYAVPEPKVKPAPRRLSPYWLAVPAFAAAALLLYFWPREPNWQAVEDAVRDFDCASIEVVHIEKGQVTLSGHVASDEELDEVRHKVLSVPRVRGLSEDLKVIPRPFCKVMEVLGPIKNISSQRGSGLTINPSKGCDAIYHDGEALMVEVSAKKPLRYVYVDYYDAGRESVAHLLPNPYDQNNDLDNSQSLTLPGSNDKWSIEIQQPYGREMVTVVSSPKALFSSPREETETADDYLISLEEALKAQASNPEVTADYCFTTSASR